MGRQRSFKLRTVDQESAETSAPVAILVHVGEKRKPSGNSSGLGVFSIAFGLLVAGNPVVDELGRGRVVAHDDEHRWAAKLRHLLPLREHLRVEIGRASRRETG